MAFVSRILLGLCLAGVAASAQAACLTGAYRGKDDAKVIVTNPEGGARYTFVDGRKGALADAEALARCVDGAVSIRDGSGGWSAAERMPMRLTPTRFKSGKLTLAGLLIEPETDGKPPLVVMVHGSEKTPAIGSAYPLLLAAQGVSTFVFDKRGTGNSEGAYTQNFQWLADDVVAASNEAKRLAGPRRRSFGLFGGSQGGWVAPLAANRAGADFVVVGFGLVLSPLEEDSEQVFDELRGKGADAATMEKARRVTDATGAVIASHFRSGYDALARVKAQYGDEPWFKTIDGEFTGEVLRTDPEELRRNGREKFDNLDILWRYDAAAALKAVKAPQLWVMAGEDREAPGGLSRERLAKLAQAGEPIEIYVFPHTDHGINEFVQAADGSRRNTRVSEGYFRLITDWMKGTVRPPYGTAVLQPYSGAHVWTGAPGR